MKNKIKFNIKSWKNENLRQTHILYVYWLLECLRVQDFPPSPKQKRMSDWYKRRCGNILLPHIINLPGLASFSLLISRNITIYLVPKARRKWSIRCSGRTRVISHFTNRYIFGTGTIALFHKITLRPHRTHWSCGIVRTTHHQWLRMFLGELLQLSHIFALSFMKHNITVYNHIQNRTTVNIIVSDKEAISTGLINTSRHPI